MRSYLGKGGTSSGSAVQPLAQRALCFIQTGNVGTSRGSQRTLGKTWLRLSHPFLLVHTSVGARGHVQPVAGALNMQRFSLHFPAPPNLTNTRPTKGGNGSMLVLQRIRNNCHRTHNVSFTYSKRAWRLLCFLRERDQREHIG